MPPSSSREIGSEMVGALHHSSGSYEMVLGAVIAALVGFGLDRLFGTTPLLAIVFAFLGFFGAAIGIFYTYRAKMAAAEMTRDARRQQGGSA